MLSDLVDTIIKINMDDIIGYNFPLNKPFGLEIIHNEIIYDFIIKLSSDNQNLICFGSGHNGRNMRNSKNQIMTPPFLNRWSYYKHFNESIIAYADPTFFRDDYITLGWYVGGNEWYLKTISEIIKKICINHNINQNNILFYGSSGGGFASIGLATLIKDSKALVNNSSFDVKDITKQHYINLMIFLKNEIGQNDENKILKNINHRLNLNCLFKKMEYVPEMCIYVNISSPLDFKNRTKLFLKDLFENPFFKNNLTLQYYYDPTASNNGHNSTIHNNEIKIIKLFSKSNLYNHEKTVDSYLKLVDQFDIMENDKIDYNIFKEIKKYNTARFDIKNHGNENNSIDIIDISDDKSTILTPQWFSNEEGIGYLIESNANTMRIKLKCINDGDLKITLRSKYITDKNKKNFPIYLDYTKFKVNNINIINKNTLIHCFKPYIYKKTVKNNEIIDLIIEWLPFNQNSIFDE